MEATQETKKAGAAKAGGVKKVRPAASAPISSVFGSKAQVPQRPLFDNVTKQEEEQKLIALLQSDGAEFDKDTACRRLAVIGTKASVPALAALLSNEHLCDVARCTLETIPDPAADEALRAAMGNLKGRLLIGVINSIGVRKDAKAVEALAKRLGGDDAELAAACAAALARIGGPEASKALEQALASGPEALKPTVGDACIALADNLLVAGKNAEAAAVFDKVRATKLPKPRLLAATRGAIVARGTDGAALLIEQIRAEDWEGFDLGLRLAREIKGADLTRALAAEVGKLPPPRQALLLQALGDRRDAAALAVVVGATQSGDPKVCVAALQAAAQLADAMDVPDLAVVSMLFEAAVKPQAEVAEAGKAGLAGIRNTNAPVNDAIVARLADKDAKVRCVAVEAAGKRLLSAAVPQLVKAADDSDAAVRVAVLTALTDIALAHRGEAAAKAEAKKAALALADKLAQSNPSESAAAKKKLTEPLAKEGPVPMRSPGL